MDQNTTPEGQQSPNISEQPNEGNRPAVNENNVQAAPVVSPQSPQPTQTVQTSTPFPSQQAHTGKSKKPTGLIVGVGLALLLIVGSAAAYFGYVLPNRPENIWKQALSNTATGYDQLIGYADEQKEVKGAKIKGNFSLNSQGAVGDGNIEGAYYEKQGQGTFDVGFAGSRYTVEFRAVEVENADTPDIYLKANGIGAIGSILGAAGGSTLGVAVENLEEQWVFIDHTLLDQLAATANSETADQPELTNEEALALARQIGEVNREYLFNDDESKAVFRVAEEVGKESYEDRNAYKFKVGVHRENLKSYITALKEELKDTKLPELIGDEASYDQGFDDLIKSIDEGDDEFFENETADVWVDMKTKLIRNVRFSDKENANNYVDVSLLYEGGDAYPFRVTLNDDESKTTVSVLTTLDTAKDSLQITLDGKSEEEDFEMSGSLIVSPQNEPIVVEKPTNARPVMEVIAEFYSALYGTGLDETLPSGELNEGDLINPIQLRSNPFESLRL